jgi:hypothetical protein
MIVGCKDFFMVLFFQFLYAVESLSSELIKGNIHKPMQSATSTRSIMIEGTFFYKNETSTKFFPCKHYCRTSTYKHCTTS